MGLDMHLTAEVYISSYSEEHRKLFNYIKNKAPEGLKGFEPTHVSFEVGYWRKANAIHKWFVDNVQDGKDDCQTVEVSFDKLLELKDVCQRVLNDKKLAPELLPCSSGFFFGSVEYNKYYFDDVSKTVEIIDSILTNPCHEYWEIKYRSSW
jgi:hypothetical protein